MQVFCAHVEGLNGLVGRMIMFFGDQRRLMSKNDNEHFSRNVEMVLIVLKIYLRGF